MQNALFIALVSLAIALGGCAGKRTQSEPDWINGNSASYPNIHYLTGRGQAANAAVARDRARADLAKIFQVNITEQSQDTIKHTRDNNGEASLSSLQSETSRDIVSRTEQTLSNIEIAELWQHPTNKQFHAFAVLDRLKAGTHLRSEIQQLDKMVSKSMARAQQQTDLLARIGAASHAVENQLVRENLQRQLKVVDTTGAGVSSPHNLAALIQDRDSLLKRIRIDSSITSDPLGGLEAVINGALSHAGFLNESRKPDYELSAHLTLSDFRDDRGWYWFRGTLMVSLDELPGNQNRGSHRWNVKVSAQLPDVAAKRVMDDLDRQLKNELRSVIVGFAKPE